MREASNLNDMMAEKRRAINQTMQGMVVPYKRFDKSTPTLYKEDPRNAGFDLFARLGEEGLLVKPGQVVRIPLNVAMDLPPLYVGLLFQRSSTYKKWGIKLTNGVGVIDSSFNGDNDEWAGEFKNETDHPVVIHNGDKICQAVILPLAPTFFVEVDTLGNADRGGFGTSFDNAKELDNEQEE